MNENQAEPSRLRRLFTPMAVTAAALLLGATTLVVAGTALANRGDDTRDPSAKAEDSRWFGMPGGGHHVRGPGAHLGMMGGIHGEFVARDGQGGFRTYLTQRGEVTAVDSSSLTVKSDDGYTRTYAVTDETTVNAGRDGLDDVAVGADVHVMGVRRSGTDTALRIGDLTRLRDLRDGAGMMGGGMGMSRT